MCFILLNVILLIRNGYTQSPPEIIDKIVQEMIVKNASNCKFFEYQYGGAIIIDSMYRATEQFSSKRNNFNTSATLDYNNFTLPILNEFIYNDSWTPAWQIVNGQIIPWNSSLWYKNGAIGDHVGLFPITYLDALLYEYMVNKDENVFDFNGKYSTQWKLIFTTADYYILQFPRYLPDQYRTVSRPQGSAWQNETDKNSSFIWADDNYMGLALLSRLAQVLDFCDKNVQNCNGINVENNISLYVDWVYNENMGFASHLIYPQSKYNGLYAHGYNYADDHHSCCPWGRANAWIMGAHVEALQMFLYLNNTSYSNQYNDILKLYQNHINEITDLQDTKDGKWRQVINDSSTFHEASCSTGFLNGIIYGRLNNILPMNVRSNVNDWDNIIDLGWKGLLGFVNMTSGEIHGACQGTGIQNDVQQYEERSTEYCKSGGPGDPAFVINAITAYQQYLNMKNMV